MNVLAMSQFAVLLINFTLTMGFKEPPSVLSRRLRCPAYTPAPFDNALRAKFQGLHAVAMVRVIARHIKRGFNLIGVEIMGKGFKIDLLQTAAIG